MIPPGEDAPIVYTFGKGEREMTDSLLPGVSVKVTERHDRRCDAVIAWTSAAGAVVADDLMARARDLWGELGGLEGRANDQAKTPPAADDSSSEDRLTQYEERLRVDIGNANGTARRRLALIAVWRKNPTAVAKESYEILAAMLSKHDELAAPYGWNVRDDIEVVERESGISMRERRKPKTRI